MRTRWKDKTRYCVATSRLIVCAVIVFSIFVETRQQQRDIKSKWDNRLLPTNSVYEQPQNSVPPSGSPSSVRSSNENRRLADSRISDRSSGSLENVEDDEEPIYDDDYENEETEDEVPNVSSSVSTNSGNREDRSKTEKSSEIDESADSTIHQDDDYFYYDDYENPKSPENGANDEGKDSVDYVESSDEEIASPTSSEVHQPPGDEKITPETTTKPIISTTRSPIIESSIPNASPTSSEVPPMEDESEKQVSDPQDGQILIGEAVVSVVTTKSVVNGTISVPVSPLPMTTEQMSSPIIPTSTPNPGPSYPQKISNHSSDSTDETTEDSIIVASVQTSRSISGARFLPFLVVDAIEKNSSDDQNNPPSDKNPSHESKSTEFVQKNLDQVEKSMNEDAEKSFVSSTTTRRTSSVPDATESIIDKLDRVQSELSSGFLASGFRTSNGNGLQLDVLSEQRPQQSRKSYTTTSRTPVISKFVPRRYNQERKVSPTSASVLGKIAEASSLEEDGGKNSTDKFKFRWPSSSSRISRPASALQETHAAVKNNVRPFGSSVPGKSRTSVGDAVDPVQDITAFLPPGYKLKKEDDEVTEKSVLSEILAKSKIDISSLLPKNYQPKAEGESTKDESSQSVKSTEEETERKIPIVKNLESLFSKTKLNLTSLLPMDYEAEGGKVVKDAGTVSKTSGETVKTDKSIQDLFSKASVDISALLPPGYNKFKKDEGSGTEKAKDTTVEMTTVGATVLTTARTVGGSKIVFPSRPGGRKALHKSATTTHSPRAEIGGPGAVSPKIQRGWPIRSTTEFTGWPTPSTTPISIEKLLEAARTATVASINVSTLSKMETSSTTSTSTTTTTTQRPTTPGICEEECEVAGTIRIVGNATWVPELLDRNTREWQLLAEEIEKEMNLVFAESSVLSKWYKRVRIDAFSPGSILVDYFIELTDLKQRINTQELKVIFHDSLTTYNTDKWNETRVKGPMRLGEFAIDPKSTDFVVIPKSSLPQQIEVDDRLIPQWAIAVIVIGVGGLVFTIIFGVSVLVSRQNAAKSKPSQPVYSGEIAKNMIQASHGAPSHRSSQDYPKSEISTIWNDSTPWREKSFESNSNEVLVDGTLGRERHMDRHHHHSDDHRKYNMYDSWRSEWNGYYYNPSQGSSKFAGYESTTNLSRHPPDYDTNF